MPIPKYIRVTAPGRICLFGEHQDFLGLPVIACAIELGICPTVALQLAIKQGPAARKVPPHLDIFTGGV